jgi:23S rRNA (cytidine1920-2'-O)/16S rRNA (cytidine1409-2'-O)-methyltransferase
VSLRTEHHSSAGHQPQQQQAYVSRGGVKLANVLAVSRLPVKGRRALDVGASTGGFTDCLLKTGAARVITVDVGYGQLDWGLRNDPRVHVLERVNARSITPAKLPYAPELAVIDVSFISLAKVLPAVLSAVTHRHDVLALIKPQFEVGRERVGKGGVVRRAEHRRQALASVGESALELGEAVLGFYPAGLAGPKGNRETFIWIAEADRPGGTREVGPVQAMAAQAEPEGMAGQPKPEGMAGQPTPEAMAAQAELAGDARTTTPGA